MTVRTCFFQMWSLLHYYYLQEELRDKTCDEQSQQAQIRLFKGKSVMLFHWKKEGIFKPLSSHGWAPLLCQGLSEYTGAEHSHAVEEQQFLHHTQPSAQRKGALTINSSQFLVPHIDTVHPNNQLQHIQIQGT